MGRAIRSGLLCFLVVAAAACGGSAADPDPTTTATADPAGSDQPTATTSGIPDTTAAAAPEPDNAQPDPSGSIDGSDIDWATVDLTTIDWANIDMNTIDFQAISANPTAANLTEDTSKLIASRIFQGSATLTIGDEVWEFDNFVCAFGHDNTESDVYSFTSNSFGEHSDGTRVQMQANVRNQSGDGRVEGDGLTHETFVNDIEDFDNPAVDWEMNAPTGLTIDGNFVMVEGLFDDGRTDGDDAVAGTLEAECGTTSRR